MFKLLKNASLAEDRLDQVFAQKLVFAYNFDCVKTTRVLFARQDNPTEPSTANHAKLFEIIDLDVSLLRQAYSRLYVYL